jgi:hypothetical protein
MNKIREAGRNVVNKGASQSVVNKGASQSVVKKYGWLKQFMAVSINSAGFSVGL